MATLNNPVPTPPLQIGGLIFPNMDQTDFTAPFEVLSRIPNSTFHVIARESGAIRDTRGLILTPEKTFANTPPLDVLLVPGGPGVDAVMENEVDLAFVREQAAHVKILLSVCTGALLCGAAGLLKGRRATTHWASHELLKYFGATPVHERVVVDGNLVTTAGISAGLDGALRVAAMLAGDQVAQGIQLYMEYAPEPPFNSGTPKTAPQEILAASRADYEKLLCERFALAKHFAAHLGIKVED